MNLNNREILERIKDNLHIDKDEAKIIARIRRDQADILREVYRRTEYPRKEVFLNISNVEDISEDFNDLTYITGIDIGDFTKSASDIRLTAPTLTGKFYIEELRIINVITLNTIRGTGTGANPTGTIKVLTEDGLTELFSEAIELTGSTNTFTVYPGVNTPNCYIEISLTMTTSTYAYIGVDSISYQNDWNRIDMPDDFLIPLEVNFMKDSSTKYLSNELTAEEFLRWRPNVSTSVSEDLYEFTVTGTVVVEDENIKYDNTVGFFFNHEVSKTSLYWKPKVTGYIQLWYSYLPDITTPYFADLAKIAKAYSDILVNGCTVKELERKLVNAKTEVELAALRLALSRYDNRYTIALSEFEAFASKKNSVMLVAGWDFLNDVNMLRS